MAPLILVVEDEPPLAEMLCYNLEKADFRTVVAFTGEEAIGRAEIEIPDLVVVDWMLPERSGLEVCRILRGKKETRHIPIIMLTARGEEGDRVLGLEAGADDYINKPIKPKVLVSRVKALLRRKTSQGIDQNISSSSINISDLNINRESYQVERDGIEISLPRKEFEILYLLATKPGKVFKREEIFDKVWGDDVIVGGRTIDVHVRKLRRKLGRDYIVTVKGVGYKFIIEE